MQRQTADIIAFPAPAPTLAPTVAPAQVAQDRLARALAELDAALAEQRSAIAKWRDGMTDLQTGMSQLAASVRGLQGSLSQLAERNAEAHAEALRLEAWADGVIRNGSQK